MICPGHRLKDPFGNGEVCLYCQLDKLLLQKDELLKAADALLGKMGGPNSPVQPVYEDEFLVLELLVDKLNGNDVESIERRAKEKRVAPVPNTDRQHLLERCYLELYASLNDEREHKREDCLKAAKAIAKRIAEIDRGK